jgi:hypothetical protein
MDMPQLTAAQIQEISALVANYIREQRGYFAGRVVNLLAALKLPLVPFFRPDVLNTTRVVELQNERVANPNFYPMLENLGFTDLPDFSTMAAITFNDVIVSHQPLNPGLLFHELIHVEQYRQLGVNRFAELYVKGFLEGGCYEAIPLELNAYGLEGNFRKAPHRGFSVEHEVAAWLQREAEDEIDLSLET